MKLKKLRNALLVVLTLALVSATAVAATWAVVNHASNNSKENTFTTPNLALEIGEDKWDAKDYGSDTAVEPTSGGTHDGKIELPYSKDGNNPIYMAPDELGESLAQKYNPDQAIVKNPSLKNTSDVATPTAFMSGITNNEWVGMKVDYRVKAYDGSAYTLYKISGTGEDAVAELINNTEFVDSNHNETLTTGTSNTKWYSFPSRSAFETAIAQLSDTAVVDDPYSNSLEYAAPAASNTANTWVTNDPNGQKFYYTSVISPEGNTYGEGNVALPCTTTNLFEYVHIKKDWTSTEAKIKTGETVATAKTTFYEIMTVNGTKYYATSLPEFDIVLKGYAVQADEVTWTNAPTALSDLMANN